ncbi:MAG: AAA family ATPase, partial [Cyanobacteria bacterium P01_H01_bin.15]
MTDSPNSSPSPNIEQKVIGDRNTTIGVNYGSITVYYGSAQVQDVESIVPTARKLGPNPYKGLLAFFEADRDRFFGREAVIATLWEKFRDLHEREGAVRFLPIYGPSGSGKSSVARAGLIPELGERPLPGRDRARVAVMVPGTEPLQALAGVLAQIATDERVAVKKAREFASELTLQNGSGQFDGLQRIAVNLPEIASCPLVVLVDQFEETYSLCKDTEQQRAFVGNLLYAAGSRSQYVSVICTLRSDFLGETQKNSQLNHLFSDQGFLVPIMGADDLEQAIQGPARQAESPLDQGTVDRLIEQTLDREGALPLLQFALTRIWEGQGEGKEPAETLKQIGGVGGALAGEAQRVYDSLPTEAERAIARRVFLGVVQLGEGARDTRRRAVLANLQAATDDATQFSGVVKRFADRGVRLLTLAGDEQATVEVTHEALFEHWGLLNEWLDGSRDDLRFQRRLEAAVSNWVNQGRPEGSLWRPPDLDLLETFREKAGNNLTTLQVEFANAARQAECDRVAETKRNRQWLQGLTIGALSAAIVAIAGAGMATWQTRIAQRETQRAENQTVRALNQTAITHLSNNEGFDALAAATRAGWRLQLLSAPNRKKEVLNHVKGTLLETGMLNLWEYNRLQGHSQGVNAVSYSPDGSTVASASNDGTVQVWQADGAPIATLEGHSDAVWAVSYSPDGSTVASASNDGTVQVWQADG